MKATSTTTKARDVVTEIRKLQAERNLLADSHHSLLVRRKEAVEVTGSPAEFAAVESEISLNVERKAQVSAKIETLVASMPNLAKTLAIEVQDRVLASHRKNNDDARAKFKGKPIEIEQDAERKLVDPFRHLLADNSAIVLIPVAHSDGTIQRVEVLGLPLEGVDLRDAAVAHGFATPGRIIAAEGSPVDTFETVIALAEKIHAA